MLPQKKLNMYNVKLGISSYIFLNNILINHITNFDLNPSKFKVLNLDFFLFSVTQQWV